MTQSKKERDMILMCENGCKPLPAFSAFFFQDLVKKQRAPFHSLAHSRQCAQAQQTAFFFFRRALRFLIALAANKPAP
jgi:hypothetical protein